MKVILKENETLEIEVSGTDGVFVVSYGGEVKDALTVHSTMPDDTGQGDLIYYTAYGESPTDEECVPAEKSESKAGRHYGQVLQERNDVYKQTSTNTMCWAIYIPQTKSGIAGGKALDKFQELKLALSEYFAPDVLAGVGIDHEVGIRSGGWIVFMPTADEHAGLLIETSWHENEPVKDQKVVIQGPKGFRYMQGMTDYDLTLKLQLSVPYDGYDYAKAGQHGVVSGEYGSWDKFWMGYYELMEQDPMSHQESA